MILTATRVLRKGFAMIDLARAIQEDRRHQADINRVVSNLPKERSVSVGRYRVTVSKRSGTTLPAA
jgi:hypothetical protein